MLTKLYAYLFFVMPILGISCKGIRNPTESTEVLADRDSHSLDRRLSLRDFPKATQAPGTFLVSEVPPAVKQLLTPPMQALAGRTVLTKTEGDQTVLPNCWTTAYELAVQRHQWKKSNANEFDYSVFSTDPDQILKLFEKLLRSHKVNVDLTTVEKRQAVLIENKGKIMKNGDIVIGIEPGSPKNLDTFEDAIPRQIIHMTSFITDGYYFDKQGPNSTEPYRLANAQTSIGVLRDVLSFEVYILRLPEGTLKPVVDLPKEIFETPAVPPYYPRRVHPVYQVKMKREASSGLFTIAEP